jgi:hypothetical protein
MSFSIKAIANAALGNFALKIHSCSSISAHSDETPIVSSSHRMDSMDGTLLEAIEEQERILRAQFPPKSRTHRL